MATGSDVLAVPFPNRLRDRLRLEHRMGVWRINVELIDGSTVADLFTNGVTIYRLIGWDLPGFSGEKGSLHFSEDDIKDIRQPV